MAVEGKREWHWRLLSGFIRGVASLRIVGLRATSQDPYDPISNPTGWETHQAVPAAWVDERMEKLVQHIMAQTAAIEANTEVQRAILALLNEAHFRDYRSADYADSR